MEYLENSKYWQRSGGRDHVIPMTHPNAFRFLRQLVNASILIVADFGRYPKEMARLGKDVVSPYVHVVESFDGDDGDDSTPDPYESRSTLLYFRGNTVRKADGKIRRQLEKLLAGNSDVRYEKSVATTQNIKVVSSCVLYQSFTLCKVSYGLDPRTLLHVLGVEIFGSCSL